MRIGLSQPAESGARPWNYASNLAWKFVALQGNSISFSTSPVAGVVAWHGGTQIVPPPGKSRIVQLHLDQAEVYAYSY